MKLKDLIIKLIEIQDSHNNLDVTVMTEARVNEDLEVQLEHRVTDVAKTNGRVIIIGQELD